MQEMKTIKSRSEAIRVYKNVRSKMVVLERTEGALRQAPVLRKVGQTPGSYMQGLSWVREDCILNPIIYLPYLQEKHHGH